LAWRP